MHYYVYKITNDINDMIYIGQTTETLEQRFKRHTGYQTEDGTYFHRAVSKYGAEHFKIELVCECSNQEELDQAEIDTINSYPRERLYNTKFVKGKCGGDTLSNNPNLPEISKKLSESKMGAKNPRARTVYAHNITTNE